MRFLFYRLIEDHLMGILSALLNLLVGSGLRV